MTDEKNKRSLLQEEIDKAVAAGGKPRDPGREHCDDHWCDPTFKCSQPFTKGEEYSVQEHHCNGHTCDDGHSCPEPFTCHEAHSID